MKRINTGILVLGLLFAGCSSDSSRQDEALGISQNALGSFTVYNNGSLAAGWTDISNTSHKLNSTTVLYQGLHTLSFTMSVWGWVSAETDNGVSGNDGISFYIYGGANTAPKISSEIKYEGVWSSNLGLYVPSIAVYCDGGVIPKNAWTHCTIPLSVFGATSSTVVQGISFDGTGKSLKVMALSTIQFVSSDPQGTGGAPGTGGSPGTGGAATGGDAATGGAATGGNPPTGGNQATGGASSPSTVVATHFSITDGQATMVGNLPPQSGGVTVSTWAKFATTGLSSLGIGASNLFYQNYGFYAQSGNVWWWDENFGPDQIATNDGGWIFVIARWTSASHIDVGYTRTAGAPIIWSVGYTVAQNALQGMTVSFPMENEWFGGDIQYMSVLPRAVDNAEASALSNNAAVPMNAWAFWKFENGVTTDASGNGHHWVTQGSVTPATTGAPISP